MSIDVWKSFTFHQNTTENQPPDGITSVLSGPAISIKGFLEEKIVHCFEEKLNGHHQYSTVDCLDFHLLLKYSCEWKLSCVKI